MARAVDSAEADAPLVNLSEIAEIELFILKRMKEYTLGDHASVFKGSGFNGLFLELVRLSECLDSHVSRFDLHRRFCHV